MQRILSNPENLGKAFVFHRVDGEWVAEEVGEMDPAVRKMMEEDYLQATVMTPTRLCMAKRQRIPLQRSRGLCSQLAGSQW